MSLQELLKMQKINVIARIIKNAKNQCHCKNY